MEKNLNIKLAKTAGFCFGVERAVNKTEKSLGELSHPIYCLGDIIHNDFVIDDLNKKGLKVIDSVEEAKNESVVILRAHGIELENIKKLKEKNCKIIIIPKKVTKAGR